MPKSISEALNEAFDAAEAATRTETPEEEQATAETAESEQVEAAPENETLESEAPESEATESEAAETPEPAKPAEGAGPRKSKLKPPGHFGKAVEEHWDDIPEPVQEQLRTREREIADFLQNSARERKAAQRMYEIANQYAPIMAAEGVQDPLQAFEGMMRVAATLRTGGKQQRAQAMAHLIQNYDIDIEALDSALAGVVPDQNTQQEQERINELVQQQLQQQLQPMQQYLQQQQQQQYMQVQQQVNQDIEAFARDKPYFDEVAGLMADYIELATAQGRQVTYAEAYERACMAHPQVAQKLLEEHTAHLAPKPAASSLSGKPRGSQQQPPPTDLRASLEAAFEQFE